MIHFNQNGIPHIKKKGRHNMKIKKNKVSVNSILSSLFLISMLILLAFSVKTAIDSKRTGDSNYVFGYRLIYLTSGSMEPTIKTNGMALTKRVNSINDIEEGDIISFQTTLHDGTAVRATHRIYSISPNGEIFTKGDNNAVIDAFPVRIENVESKVCLIFNFTAWVINKWKCGASGKVLLVMLMLGVILTYVILSLAIQKFRKLYFRGKHTTTQCNNTNSGDST